MSELPVAVIGAGPQGLAAAAHLLERGLEPLVLEAGDGPASAVSEWGHVRLFSPWPELVDKAAARLLEPAGADGLPALGERAAVDLIRYEVPDFGQPGGFAGKHTVVVGSGHSAATAIIELGRIAEAHPGTTITWALRRGVIGNTFGGGTADQLPERGALGLRARRAVEDGLASLVTGFRTERIRRDDAGRAVLVAEDRRELAPADSVVVLTGFRPDLSFLSEMRLDLDATLQAPRRIAAEIDPNIHSCGTVAATGAKDLAHPEPGLYLAGMKSYGRAPTFLAMTGYEQVRSVAAELAGDHEAAARVELALPDTGVCGGAGLFDDPDGASGGGCCAPAPSVLQIGRAPASA
jgi:glycine/D-amino acid oxidase-like deaminating enzyme